MKFLSAILAFLCTAGILTSNEAPKKLPIPEGNLVFEDNFDGTSLDKTKWSRCPEYERCEGYTYWSDDCSYLDGEGHLVLHAEWDSEKGRMNSGAVRTFRKFEFGLGYYEASIKFDNPKGLWGAFWMMVGNVGNTSDPTGAKGIEIDIVESIFADENKCQHALHWNGYGDKHKSTGTDLTNVNIYDGSFHTFGLERTEDAYIFYIDNAETARYTSEEIGICKLDGYMKLSVECAQWAGAGTPEAINALPSDMLVDYVRVYREKPQS